MPTEKKLLLVDANIISHALTINQTPEYFKLFARLEKKYRFVCTGFTKYEITCTSDKEHKVKTAEYLEQNMAYVTLSKALMDFSAKLCYLYQQHPSTKSMKISVGDIVNGAFSIAKPSHVLTIDNLDYPAPFFMEVDRQYIKYKASKKNHNITDVVRVLEPDVELVKASFNTYGV